MTRVPDLLVERLALGELEADQAREVRRRLEAEAGGLERLAAIDGSNLEILASLPPRRVAAEVERRLGKLRPQLQRRVWQPLWVAAPALAGALVVALIVLLPPADRPVLPGDDGPDTTRIKGLEAHLRVYRKSDGDPELLAPGDRARSGDVLQLSYVAAGKQHGVLLSIDGRGTVTLHFPERAAGSTHLQRRGETALPHAYRLDDAPRFERFVLLTSDRPLEVLALLGAAENLGDPQRDRLKVPSDVDQHSVLIRKETP
jgi:hypothetical protein